MIMLKCTSPSRETASNGRLLRVLVGKTRRLIAVRSFERMVLIVASAAVVALSSTDQAENVSGSACRLVFVEDLPFPQEEASRFDGRKWLCHVTDRGLLFARPEDDVRALAMIEAGGGLRPLAVLYPMRRVHSSRILPLPSGMAYWDGNLWLQMADGVRDWVPFGLGGVDSLSVPSLGPIAADTQRNCLWFVAQGSAVVGNASASLPKLHPAVATVAVIQSVCSSSGLGRLVRSREGNIRLFGRVSSMDVSPSGDLHILASTWPSMETGVWIAGSDGVVHGFLSLSVIGLGQQECRQIEAGASGNILLVAGNGDLWIIRGDDRVLMPCLQVGFDGREVRSYFFGSDGVTIYGAPYTGAKIWKLSLDLIVKDK